MGIAHATVELRGHEIVVTDAPAAARDRHATPNPGSTFLDSPYQPCLGCRIIRMLPRDGRNGMQHSCVFRSSYLILVTGQICWCKRIPSGSLE